MKEYDEQGILNVHGSDMKLWDEATTVDEGEGWITKAIKLPFGIGEVEVKLEGLHNAEAKRAALGAFGEHIRGLVSRATDDSEIEARAKQAHSRAEQVDSRDSVRDAPVGQVSTESDHAVADRAHQTVAEDPADFGATLTDRRASLIERIGDGERQLKQLKRELKAIQAAIFALEDDDEAV